MVQAVHAEGVPSLHGARPTAGRHRRSHSRGISIVAVAVALIAAVVAMSYPMAFLLPLAMLAVLIVQANVNSRHLTNPDIHPAALWASYVILMVGAFGGLLLSIFLTPSAIELHPGLAPF